jgi:hypothetical protein
MPEYLYKLLPELAQPEGAQHDPGWRTIEADSIVQAQQKLIPMLLAGQAEEAMIYAPMRRLSVRQIIEVRDDRDQKLDNAAFFSGKN